MSPRSETPCSKCKGKGYVRGVLGAQVACACSETAKAKPPTTALTADEAISRIRRIIDFARAKREQKLDEIIKVLDETEELSCICNTAEERAGHLYTCPRRPTATAMVPFPKERIEPMLRFLNLADETDRPFLILAIQELIDRAIAERTTTTLAIEGDKLTNPSSWRAVGPWRADFRTAQKDAGQVRERATDPDAMQRILDMDPRAQALIVGTELHKVEPKRAVVDAEKVALRTERDLLRAVAGAARAVDRTWMPEKLWEALAAWEAWREAER